MTTTEQLKELRKMTRRQVRYRLFRIREGQLEGTDEWLKKYIEKQFRQGMVWAGFTFTWDVGVNDSLRVVDFEEYIIDGGRTLTDKRGMIIREPPAFTKQEI